MSQTAKGAVRARVRFLGEQVMHYGISAIVPAVLGLVFAAVFTRTLTTAEFGRFSLVSSLASLAAAISGQWVQQGLIRYLPGEQVPAEVQAIKGAAALALGLAMGGLLILGAGFGLAARRVLAPEWMQVLVPGVGVAIGWCAVNALSAVLQASQRAARYSAYRLAEAVFRFLVTVVLVFAVWRNAAALLWAQVASLGVVLPILWWDAGLPGPQTLRRTWRASIPKLGALARYGSPLVGFFVAAIVLDVSPRYVIQAFRGSEEVGIYGASYGLIAGGLTATTAPVLLAAHPILMRAWARDERSVAAYWLGIIVEYFAIIGLLLTALLWLLGRDVAGLLLGPDFRSGSSIMPPVMAGLVVWQLSMYAHKPLEFAGKTGVMLSVAVLVAVLNLVMNLMVIPAFGYRAAAYTTLGSYGLYAAITFQLGQRELPWRLNARRIAGFGALIGATTFGAGRAAELLDRGPGYPWALVFKLVVASALVGLVGSSLARRLPTSLAGAPPPTGMPPVALP